MSYQGVQDLPRPFEVDQTYLADHIDEMVGTVFADLQSQFLVLPKGSGFVEYTEFERAYEVLKRHTSAFREFTEDAIWSALQQSSLSFLVLRTVLGMSPPEWAELTRSEQTSDVSQGNARTIDRRCRADAGYLARLLLRPNDKTLARTKALVAVAADYIRRGAPPGAADTVHRLAKVDTAEGIDSLQHVAAAHVPYAVLLYERYLGRPFASHRDAVSELIGEVMENAIEERLSHARITFRKTNRAERVPGYDQAPDFFVPDEYSPAVLIEAKVAGDDGTARDKVARILRLCEMRDRRVREGTAGFEVVACIDGRGFGVRREDMRAILRATDGKVFTLATLDQLIPHTGLQMFQALT